MPTIRKIRVLRVHPRPNHPYLSLFVLILAAGCAGPVPATPAPSPTGTVVQSTPAATILATPERSIRAMPAKPPHGVSGGASIGDAYIPSLGNTGYDVQAYNLAFKLNLDRDTLSATAQITATATLDVLGRISLDFSGYPVEAVRVGGQPAAFYADDSQEKLFVDLPRSYASGETLAIQVVYGGEILPQASGFTPGSSPVGIIPSQGQSLIAFSEPDGAHAWFPCNDHPLDKALFHVEITVPDGLAAVSNGRLVETRRQGGLTTFVWVEDSPMATYLLALAVGSYRRIDDPLFGQVQIRHYAFTGDSRAGQVFGRSGEILQFLSDLIAPYPFAEYGNVEIEKSSWAAMETQTMVMVAEGVLSRGDAAAVLAHEAAHHWFGDSVSLSSWGDLWLNEGFATFFEGLWREHEGLIQPKFYATLEQRVLSRAEVETGALVDPTPTTLFGVNTYLKGAWVLRMLQQELGDEVFFQAVRAYYRRFAFGNARTSDLQSVLEEASGKDLEAFFQQWAYTPGNPQLEITWTSQAGGTGSAATVQVCQGQAAVTYDVPLELEFLSTGGEQQLETLQVDQRREQVRYALPFAPQQMQADPDQALLAEVSVAQVEALAPCAP